MLAIGALLPLVSLNRGEGSARKDLERQVAPPQSEISYIFDDDRYYATPTQTTTRGSNKKSKVPLCASENNKDLSRPCFEPERIQIVAKI